MGETRLGQGRDAAKQFFKDNPDIADDIEAKIKAAIKEEQLAAEKKSSGKKAVAKEPEITVKPSGKAQVKQNGIEAFADDFEDIEE